jgi:hypothetical protein
MARYYLTIHLHSDATFGRGEGVAGLVDVEIDQDNQGFPYLGGRALKGLLREEWHNMYFALGNIATRWASEAAQLFGTIGATTSGAAEMRVDSATLPPTLIASIRKQALQPAEVLMSLTTIRRQTAVDATTGAPEPFSLRAMRVLLRGTPLIAPLDFPGEADRRTLALLAACVLSVRRGGVLRNRGRGRMSLLLHSTAPRDYCDAAFTQQCFVQFADEVRQ